MGDSMNDYLFYVLQKRNVTVYTIFDEAFRAHYGCRGNVTEDIAMWVQSGNLPYYVRTYLESIHDRPFL